MNFDDDDEDESEPIPRVAYSVILEEEDYEEEEPESWVPGLQDNIEEDEIFQEIEGYSPEIFRIE